MSDASVVTDSATSVAHRWFEWVVKAIVVAAVAVFVVGHVIVRIVYYESPIDANERAARRALSRLLFVQLGFGVGQTVDQDGDGRGEHGYLAELTGNAVLRTRTHAFTKRALELNMMEIDGLTYDASTGLGTVSGYHVILYLPSGDGKARHRHRGKPGQGFAADADAQEWVWIAYAWPIEPGVTGRQAYCFGHMSQLFETDMEITRYSGSEVIPAAEAALAPGVPQGYDFSQASDSPNARNLNAAYAGGRPGGPAADGNTWRPVR